jgi:pimeloyl-ACP methyl ester carboxylesterase
MPDRIQIHANGVDFVCLAQGSGPLLLLVHGFPDIPQSWSSQMDALSQAGYKVIVPYLPGYLPSRVAENAYFDKASLVNGIAGLIEAVSPGEKLHYIGQDWGAIIGYALCAARPDLLHSAVLMAVPHPQIVNTYLLVPKHIQRSFHWWFFNKLSCPKLRFWSMTWRSSITCGSTGRCRAMKTANTLHGSSNACVNPAY